MSEMHEKGAPSAPTPTLQVLSAAAAREPPGLRIRAGLAGQGREPELILALVLFIPDSSVCPRSSGSGCERMRVTHAHPETARERSQNLVQVTR